VFCVAQARAWVTKEIKREKKTTDSNFTILLPIISLVSCLSHKFKPRRRSPSHHFVRSFSSSSPPLPTHLLTSTFTRLFHFLFFNQNPTLVHTHTTHSHYPLKLQLMEDVKHYFHTRYVENVKSGGGSVSSKIVVCVSRCVISRGSYVCACGLIIIYVCTFCFRV
jgi:hypothetical protein